ncbi:GNAT family N-acetyltransferase [bacterium SCSIO 12741]|nr:GNAT family N-acetyltransferase [bacterium SCSIO 12741]
MILLTQIPFQEIPMNLLLMADPSEDQIRKYLQNSWCLAAKRDDQILGVLILSPANSLKAEIKNIAVYDEYQGQGIGKKLLQKAQALAQEKGFHQIQIATGNSSIGQLALYQKMGFEPIRIEKDYFLKHYNEPIMENGIACKHRILLEKALM